MRKQLPFGAMVTHPNRPLPGVVIRTAGSGLVDVAWQNGGLSLLIDPNKLTVLA